MQVATSSPLQMHSIVQFSIHSWEVENNQFYLPAKEFLG